jgi:DNA repair protein RecN (Recombination protein N)
LLARKYQVQPIELFNVYQKLSQQLEELKLVRERVTFLETECDSLWQHFLKDAKTLHDKRVTAALKLSKKVKESIRKLGMPASEFIVQVEWQDNNCSPYGCDQIEFMISANPGHAAAPLRKVASGGEMSRIALAIYVATAQSNTTPILVFDEIDVGIGGGTAAVVGELLKTLGKIAQILCITHLPQVAAFSDHHFCVQKLTKGKQTETSIRLLSEEEKISEVARMLGGMTITKRTLAHAKELIGEATPV